MSKVTSAIDMALPFWHGDSVPSEPKFCATCGSPLEAYEVDGRTRYACSSETCDVVVYDNPVPVVAALLEHGQTVLLVRNKGWPEKWYGLISGFLEKGETPEEGSGPIWPHRRIETFLRALDGDTIPLPA
jgi:hypothetical protein